MTNYLPEIHQATLGNGLNLLAVEYGRVPWLSLAFMNKRGAETDPPGKAGVADWAAEFLTLGTARRSQLQLANDIDALGASFSGRADWDATYVHLEGLAEDFPTLMATLAEVVQTPAFPPEEFPLLKERRRAELTQLLDDPREVASRRFHRLFFGDAPYGHPVRGELAGLDRLDLGDLKDFYRRQVDPGVATLVAVGMAPFARVREEAEKLFGSWQGGGPASPPYTKAPEKICPPGIYLLDRPELTQSEIRLGFLGLPRSHPDFFPVRLVNYIFGEGGFSSRLMNRIRSELGLTYGIRSHFFLRRAPGPFVISTFTPAPHTAQAVREIQGVLRNLRDHGVTAQELAEAQSYYVGHFPLGLETPRALCRRVLSLDLHDLGRDYLKLYCERLRAVTISAAQDAARTHFKPEQMVILVVGPASRCRDDLEALGSLRMIEET